MEADGAPSTGPNVENSAEADLLKRFFATIKAVPEERRASVYRVAIAAAERSARGEDVEQDASRPHSRDPVFMALARGVVRKRDEASASAAAAKRPKKPKGPKAPLPDDEASASAAKRPKKALPGRRGGGQALPLFLGPRTIESARAAGSVPAGTLRGLERRHHGQRRGAAPVCRRRRDGLAHPERRGAHHGPRVRNAPARDAEI